MKFKERSKKFTFTPFPYEMTVVVTNDIVMSVSKRKNTIRPYHETDPYMQALTIGGEDVPFSYVFLKEKFSLKHVAHEISHVIWYFMRFIGAKPENEFIAYYVGHYIFEVTKFVMSSKKQG